MGLPHRWHGPKVLGSRTSSFAGVSAGSWNQHTPICSRWQHHQQHNASPKCHLKHIQLTVSHLGWVHHWIYHQLTHHSASVSLVLTGYFLKMRSASGTAGETAGDSSTSSTQAGETQVKFWPPNSRQAQPHQSGDLNSNKGYSDFRDTSTHLGSSCILSL